MENKKFCSSDEQEISTLGAGYQLGDQLEVGATLTNKRIYYSAGLEKKVVGVHDVTGVGFKKLNPTQYIVYAVLGLISGIVAYFLEFVGELGVSIGIGVFIIFLIVYFVSRRAVFLIEYAGGKIEFYVEWAQSDKLRTFVYNIHLVKDKQLNITEIIERTNNTKHSIDNKKEKDIIDNNVLYNVIKKTEFNDSLGLDADTKRFLSIGEKVKIINVLENFNRNWAYIITTSNKEEGWCLLDALEEINNNGNL